MAMSVRKEDWRHYPPPRGKGRVSGKAKNQQLKRVTRDSVEEQIRSQFNVAGGVVTSLEVAVAARKAVTPVLQDNQEDESPFEPEALAHTSSGDTPPPSEDTEWYPTWQFDESEPAWCNLLRNAYLMKPLGRKFRPDPSYNGKGECPTPQRTALHCAIRWNNVVPFEDALEEARSEAFMKTDNSMRSRGSDALTPVTRDYPGYESSGQPKIPKPQEPSDAVKQAPAANDNTHLSSEEMGYKDSTLSGDTDDPRDVQLQHLWYLSANVGLALYKDGFTALSNDYWAWVVGEQVCVGKLVSEMYTVEVRMDEMEFYHRLETGCDYLIPQDMVSPVLLTNEAVEVIFGNLPSAPSNEFMTWSSTDLNRFHLMVETSRRNFKATDPMKSSYFNDEPTIWDIERWEQEEKDGLESLGVSRSKEDQPSPVAANEKPVHENVDFTKIGARLRLTEEPDLWYLKWLWDNRESKPVDRSPDVIPHYLGNLRREVESVKDTHRLLVTAMFNGVSTTPWLEDKPLPPPQPAPTGKILRRANKFLKRTTHWLNKPVLTFGRQEEEQREIAPAPADDQRIIAASKAIAEQIMFESLVKKGDREAIEWLQNPDRPIEEATSPEFVGKVMYAIQDENENLLYSPTGIILGKKSRLEQVNTGGNILLLNAKAPPKTA